MTNLLVVIIVLETLLGIATTPRTINYAVEDTPLLGVGSSDQTYTLNSVLPVRTASLLDAATAGTNQPPRDYQPPRRANGWSYQPPRDYQPPRCGNGWRLPTSETTDLRDYQRPRVQRQIKILQPTLSVHVSLCSFASVSQPAIIWPPDLGSMSLKNTLRTSFCCERNSNH